MRLKSLEIKGFKSFAHETVINFNENVIGIVGPNGSGKSNIVDAIRWVLGEQKSKDLRLEQMSNVLFNGSKKTKEAGVAQVTITFDNSKNVLGTEYQTVAISRFLYRTGESEYRLNGVSCRLKDITSLLIDTGIGSNSYAIIALGMVEDILQDKDKARRKMFEQAAGISKFKVRKQETLSKLEHTTLDLERVQDLLFEIEGNLKTLEKQARQTQKYFDIKAQYKEQSIQLAIFQSQGFKQQYQNLQQQIQQEEDKYQTAEVAVSKLDAEIEKSKFQILEKEKSVSEKQKELHQTVSHLRQMEQDKKLKEQEYSFQNQTITTKEDSLRTAAVKVNFLKKDIELLKENVITEKQLESKNETELVTLEIAVKQKRNAHAQTKVVIDQNLQQMQQIDRAVFELEKQKAVGNNKLQALRTELEQSKLAVAAKLGEISVWQSQLTLLQSDYTQKNEHKILLETQEKERINSLQLVTQKISTTQTELIAHRRDLDACRHEYKLLKSLVDSLDGYPESIKYLKKHKNWHQQSPLLSDIMNCSADYRIAIENYLEPYLNHFVVDTAQDAFLAIELLQADQKGKANFFVLDQIEPVGKEVAVPMELLSAKSILDYDRKYESLVDLLFGNVYLSTKELFKVEDPKVTVISQTGKIIVQRHQIQGGSLGLFDGNKIGRSKQLEVLLEKIHSIEQTERHLDAAAKQLQKEASTLQTNTFQKEIAHANEIGRKLQMEVVAYTTKIEAAQAMQDQFYSKETEYKQSIDGLTLELDRIQEELSQQQSNLSQVRQSFENSDAENKAVAEELMQLSARFNEKNVQFIQQQNKVNIFTKECRDKERQVEELELQRNSDQKYLQQLKTDAEKTVQSIDEATNKITEFIKERKSKEQHLGSAEEQYYQERSKINELEISLKQQNRIKSDLQSLVNNLKDKFNSVKYELAAIGERLKIEFNISINDIINQSVDEKFTLSMLQESTVKLKQRIDNFGEINPMAVAAYTEMKTRYEVIVAQKSDIDQARQSLENTIKEIEVSASEKFLTSFYEIRTNFAKVFRSLFSSDDNCDLVLEDPSNPLESNIQIIAKPKGKRPQSINQLSGGEKTLTATALLFALYLLKPAPFCIFDEVDAPLDDANIEKFNNIIKEFSSESQFVIVTHNKSTMAAVDIIYGVYMPELGISSVTPVDFRSLDTVPERNTIY